MDCDDEGIDSDMPELEPLLEDENISDDEHGSVDIELETVEDENTELDWEEYFLEELESEEEMDEDGETLLKLLDS